MAVEGSGLVVSSSLAPRRRQTGLRRLEGANRAQRSQTRLAAVEAGRRERARPRMLLDSDAVRSSAGSEEYAALCPSERTDGRGFTRSELLRRAAGGGAGLVVLGGIPGLGRLVEAAPALAGPAATGDVRRFVSRPDLKPPRVTIVHPARSAAGGQLFLAPSSGPGQRGAMIVDDGGELVWFHGTFPKTAMDFRTQVYKGKHVLTWWEGQYVKGIGQIGDYVVVDRSYREIARFRPSNGLRPDFHEYLLTPEGTALVTSHDTRSANLSSVGGPAGGRALGGVVQELAIPSGRVLWEWRSLDHVGIEETYQTDVGDPFDYFHVNSIGFDYDGNLIVSARNTWTVYKVDRRSGQVIWRLGGRKSDFAMGRGTLFAFQHDARTHDRGRLLSVFDNGPHPKTKPQSRGLVLAVDTARMRVSLARELHALPAALRAGDREHPVPPGRGRARLLRLDRVLHGVRRSRQRPLRRPAPRGRSELPGQAVPVGGAAEQAAGARRAPDLGGRDALRELERRDRSRLLAGPHRSDEQPARRCGDDAAAGLRDGVPGAARRPVRGSRRSRRAGQRARPVERRQDLSLDPPICAGGAPV